MVNVEESPFELLQRHWRIIVCRIDEADFECDFSARLDVHLTELAVQSVLLGGIRQVITYGLDHEIERNVFGLAWVSPTNYWRIIRVRTHATEIVVNWFPRLKKIEFGRGVETIG